MEQYEVKVVATHILENMLKLYVQVRSFSFAKDLTYKQKLKLGTKKSRGLRKQVKQSFENK